MPPAEPNSDAAWWEWAKYVAIDATGEVWAFSEKPTWRGEGYGFWSAPHGSESYPVSTPTDEDAEPGSEAARTLLFQRVPLPENDR